MPTLEVLPHAGLNRRFPEHKLTGKSGQKVLLLKNLISLYGRIYKFYGAASLDSTSRGPSARWAKRIYYVEGSNRKRYQFAVIGNKFFRLDESLMTFNQMTISNSYNYSLETDIYPIDAQLKQAATVNTYLVDGKYFYKFNGNIAGDWERLPIKTDLDGNTMEPIHIAEYLDRAWVLVKNRNVLIGSNNLNAEVFNDASDSIIIELPPGRGGFPQALIKFRGVLYIWHEDYFVPLSGSSPSTFGVKPGDVIEGYGTRAPRSIIKLKTTMGFLNSEDNEYYTTGGTLDSTDKIPLSDDIVLKDLIDPVKANETVCVHDPNLDALRISYVLSGEAVLNAEEIYSLIEKKWCAQTRGRNISCYSLWNGNGDQNEVITGRSDTGILMKEGKEQLNFDGGAIPYKFISASYVAKDEISEAQFEEFFIDAKPESTSQINFAYFLDARITTNAVEPINMQGEIYNLGFVEFAEQNEFVNRALPFIDKSKGRMIRFELEKSDLNSKLEFYGIYAKYNALETVFSKYIPGR